MKLSAIWTAMKQEHASLWMLCIYFLFEYVRPQGVYPVLDVLPWGQLAIILTLIAAIMDPNTKWVSNVENRYMVVLAIVIIISGIIAFRPKVSLEYWSVFGSWIVVYFLSITIVNTEKRLFLFLLAYCLFSFKMAQSGAVTWAMRGFSFASFGLVGSPGWFKNSGEYAIQMLIYGSLAVAMVFALKDYWGRNKRWILYACAGTGYMAVMGASSRGSQLGLAAIGIWLLLKQKNGLKGLLMMSIAAAALYYILPDEQMQRFNEMGQDEDSLQRLTYWRYALDHVIPNNLMFGLGYFNWLPYLNFAEPNGMGPLEKNQACHNIFIQATAELGITGLIVFLLLVLYAFVNNARTRAMATAMQHRFFFILSYGLDAGLIGFLVAGSFVTVLFYPYFWIQITMIVMLNNITRRQYAEFQSIKKTADNESDTNKSETAEKNIPAKKTTRFQVIN